MKKVYIINGNKLYVDEILGNNIKVTTPSYNTYRELDMGLSDNGWYEKWIDSSNLDYIEIQ